MSGARSRSDDSQTDQEINDRQSERTKGRGGHASQVLHSQMPDQRCAARHSNGIQILLGGRGDIRRQLLIKRIQELSGPMEPLPTQIAEKLPKLRSIRALLFDLYGTLFISGTGDISLAREMSNSRALAEALENADFTGNLQKAGERGTQLLLETIQQTHTAQRLEGKTSPEVDIREEWHTVLVKLQVEDLLEGEINDETISRVSVDGPLRKSGLISGPLRHSSKAAS